MDINKALKLIIDKLYGWLQEFITMLPNLILAVIILILTFIIAKWLKSLSKNLISRISRKESINDLFSNFIYLIGAGIGLFIALSVLQLDKAVTSILAGAGIIGLALGFAFQDFAGNFIAGIFISFRNPFKKGDIVESQDYMGRIKIVTLRDTVITTFQGQDVIIPNKLVFQNPIKNYTSSGRRRVDLSVGISYGDDLEKVKGITIAAAEKVSVRSLSDEVTLFFKEFGDSSINFNVRIWLNSTEQAVYWQGLSEAIMHIKKAYDENDIMIPFPIRTLDFGIKGGEKLSEMDINIINNNSNPSSN